METMREAWTDERLDDLNQKVDRGFDRVETEIRSQRQEFKSDIGDLRAEMNARFDRMDARFDVKFDQVDARFEKIDAKFEKIDARFDSLNRTLLGFAVAALIALVAGAVGPF
jgi:hypothetical protein